jgi:hypothetical protein
MLKRQKGIVLVLVIIVAVIFAIIGLGVLVMAEQESVQTGIDVNKAKAFYLAEAGLAKMSETLQTTTLESLGGVLQDSLEQGSYKVELVESDANYYAIATGICGNVQKQIRVKMNFLAPPFENAVFAKNNTAGNWAFQLRGTGDPCQSMGTNQWGDPVLLSKGGKDIINGNILADGDVYLCNESRVRPAPAPNRWNLNGDVGATGAVSVLNSATISGATSSNVDEPVVVNLVAMDYANNNTHKVAEIFTAAGITSGPPPVGNELRDIFVKNPTDGTRKDACKTTSVNDYFFEPTGGFVDGTPFTGATPLHMGTNRVYYVDGDLWVHSDNTKGFLIDGQATIVVTGNIHICDNLQYRDPNTVLGLVALGKYDAAGNLISGSGGNIYFGDPVNGTMGYVSAMMFAAKDFLYNTDPLGTTKAEPRTGFTIYGCFAAMNQVSLVRDWYTKVGTKKNTQKAAIFDTASGNWYDEDTGTTGTALTQTEKNTLTHYRMIVNYDDRVRNPVTQPPGLPIGGAKIFAGFENWREL